MEKPNLELTDDAAVLLDLGVALGQTQTFSMMAGRCSAAQAATLLRLRQEKKYLQCAPNWREFCTKYLKISGSEANRIISHWEEFGGDYFELVQLMRISAESYRAIEPAIKDGALHHEGEAIRFDPENSRRLAAVVAQLRSAAGAGKPATNSRPHEGTHSGVADLERRCTMIILEFEEIARKERSGENRILLTRALQRLRNELSRIERDHGL